jgi:PIN domain nuclease of toxin-antitoxin system
VISAISCWEVGMLVEKGRLRLRGDTRLAIQQALQVPGLRVAAVTETIATEAGLLGRTFHGDPADRLIVATAVELGAPIVTKDERICASDVVRTLW